MLGHMSFVEMIFVLAAYIGLPVALFLLGRRVLRAIEDRPTADAQIAELTERIRSLEAQVESIKRRH